MGRLLHGVIKQLEENRFPVNVSGHGSGTPALIRQAVTSKAKERSVKRNLIITQDLTFNNMSSMGRRNTYSFARRSTSLCKSWSHINSILNLLSGASVKIARFHLFLPPSVVTS